MKRQEKKEVLNRFNYLIGHLQGNRKMVVDDKYCIDIIRQNQAVEAALKKVDKIILQSHLETCVTPAVKSKAKSRKNKYIKRLQKFLKWDKN